MKKFFLFIAALSFLFIGLSAEETTLLKVKSAVANVRLQPEGNSIVVTQLKQGTEVEAKSRKGNWYEVTVADADGKMVTGYIHMSTVEVVAAAAQVQPQETAEPARPVRVSRPSEPTARSAGGFKIALIPAMTNMSFSEPVGANLTKKARFGFGGGIGYEIPLTGMLNLELDAMFSPGGCAFKAADGKIDASGYAVTMPVLLKARFGSGTVVLLLAGGEAGYILTEKVKITLNTGATTKVDMSDEISRLYFGVIFGAGFEMPIGSMAFVLEGRYHMGFSNIYKDPSHGEWGKTNAIVLLLGLKI